MEQIPADFLIAIRAMLRSTEGGEHWTFHGAHFSDQQAVDFCLMAEVQAGIPGCYDLKAVDYRPLHHFRISTGDRVSWHIVAPEIKSLCDKHGLWWSACRTRHGRTFATLWEFLVGTARGGYRETELLTVCRSTDPRLLNLDPFKEAKEIEPNWTDGSWRETDRGFSFTCYSKRVAHAMRDRYADCQVCLDTEGRGKSTSYTLSVIFPDMIDKE